MIKTKTKSPLPWFGSEASVAKDIGGLLQGVKHLTIPFCGGLGVLPHVLAGTVTHVLANDAHFEAIVFYRVLKGPLGNELKTLCLQTLCHPLELKDAKRLANVELGLLRAWSFWARCWLGRKGAGGTADVGKSASVRRNAGGGSNASRLAAAAGDLDAWAELFRRVEFICEDFRDVLKKVKDEPPCGIYCDPPWFQTGDKYQHKFSDSDHEILAGMLSDFRRSPIVVRYGDCDQVRRLYDESAGWVIAEAASRNQSNNAVREIWICKNILV